MSYIGGIELISGLAPVNGGAFPIVNAGDVYVNDGERLSDFVKIMMLLAEDVPNTTQAIVYNDAGNVSKVLHYADGNAVVRTDRFTYEDGTIIEERSLSTGETLTKTTDLETLVTEVAYTAAPEGGEET